MPITIQKYLLEQTEFNYEPGRSGGFKQLFLVQGMDPTQNDNPARACYATDSSTGFFIPRYPTEHPTCRGFFVGRFRGFPFPKDSRTSAMVEITYLPSELMTGTGTTIEVIGSNGRKIIARWPGGTQKGQPIIVGYSRDGATFQNPLASPPDPPNPGYFYSLSTLDILSPNTVLRFSRREVGSPLNKSKQYRRTINKSPWQGGAAKTWLCTQLDGPNFAQGNTLVSPGLWNVTYSFEYDPDGWTQYPTYRDALTGTTPQNIKYDGNFNGYQLADPYALADFNQLGLPSAL